MPEMPHELLAIDEEFGDSMVQIPRYLIDGKDKRHLPLSQGVKNLAVSPCNPEDALTIGYEFDLGQVLFEASLLSKVVVSLSYSLERHSPIEQRFDHLEGNQVTEGIESLYSRPAAC